MACHAKYLRDRPSSRMTLEGNADERGSRDYNLGLGERRANSVSSALQANGGSGGQITVVSRSEEHTSELQSLMRISYAVFCLKKKIKTKQHISTTAVDK